MTDSQNPDAIARPAGGDGAATAGGPVPGGGASGPVARTGEGGTPTPVEPPKGIHIRVDRVDRLVSSDLLTDGTMTGRQIRELRNPPIEDDRDLFEIVPGGSDMKIEDDQAVVIREWMRFFSAPKTINPGSPGAPPHLRTAWRPAVEYEGTRDVAG